jgi:hypothetical protein
MIGKPFALVTTDSVGVHANSFIGLLRTSVAEALVGLFDDIANVIMEGNLTKRKIGFVFSVGGNRLGLSY